MTTDFVGSWDAGGGRLAYWLFGALVVLAMVRASSLRAEDSSDLDVLRTPETRAACAYQFSAEDEALLDEIERGAFQFLWSEVGTTTGFVKDNRVAPVSNLGGVGFQLASLPIGVKRGWVTRDAALRRTLQILHALCDRSDNRRNGVFLHFVVADTGDVYLPYRTEASTVDHALLLAGAMTAASYFGDETAKLVDAMIEATNWRAFVAPDSKWLSMGWRPVDNETMSGPGALISNTWRYASDEERLIHFLAVGGSHREYALDADAYYRLQRPLKSHADGPPFVVSWNGIPFNYFFSHCWIDYRRYGADDPRAFGVVGPRIDWFENSRRALLTHRRRCLDAAQQFGSFGDDRWGVSSCMGFDRQGKRAYLVQQVKPNIVDQEQWRGGTVAPYAAAGSIMMTPTESLSALRAFRDLKDQAGEPLVWRDPAAGGFGFLDSFNLDQGLVADDNLAIDAGPTLLAIENVRTGLVWKLFAQHPHAKDCVRRLQWQEDIGD